MPKIEQEIAVVRVEKFLCFSNLFTIQSLRRNECGDGRPANSYSPRSGVGVYDLTVWREGIHERLGFVVASFYCLPLNLFLLPNAFEGLLVDRTTLTLMESENACICPKLKFSPIPRPFNPLALPGRELERLIKQSDIASIPRLICATVSPGDPLSAQPEAETQQDSPRDERQVARAPIDDPKTLKLCGNPIGHFLLDARMILSQAGNSLSVTGLW